VLGRGVGARRAPPTGRSVRPGPAQAPTPACCGVTPGGLHHPWAATSWPGVVPASPAAPAAAGISGHCHLSASQPSPELLHLLSSFVVEQYQAGLSLRQIAELTDRSFPQSGGSWTVELVLLAADLLSWTHTLALHATPARRWEPKRLRLRLFAVAGRLVRTGRRARLNLAHTWRWTGPRLSSTPPMPCRH
jgi:hypothetical protein